MRFGSAAILLLGLTALAACGGDETGGQKARRGQSPSGERQTGRTLSAESQHAASGLQRAFPAALSEPTPVSRSIHPLLVPSGSDLMLSGSLARGGVASNSSSGMWLESAAGRMGLVPDLGDNPSEAGVVAGSAAALFASTAGADMLVRAAPAGFTIFVQLREEGARATLALDHSGEARLQSLPKGNVGVLLRNAGAVRSPSLPAGEGVAATISAPFALDARGRKVRASLGVDGNRLSLDLQPDNSPTFPVVARLEWIPSGELGGGWFAYGVDQARRRSRYTVEGKRIEGLCAEEEHGVLGEGEVEISRQVAANEGGCASLVEPAASELYEVRIARLVGGD